MHTTVTLTYGQLIILAVVAVASGLSICAVIQKRWRNKTSYFVPNANLVSNGSGGSCGILYNGKICCGSCGVPLGKEVVGNTMMGDVPAYVYRCAGCGNETTLPVRLV